MKKKIIISAIAFFIFVLGYFLFQNIYYGNKISKIKDNSDVACEVDSDCKGVLLECGQCPNHFTLAVNKKYSEKYFEMYQSKCRLNAKMICDRVLNGKAACKNKKCILVDGIE